MTIETKENQEEPISQPGEQGEENPIIELLSTLTIATLSSGKNPALGEQIRAELNDLLTQVPDVQGTRDLKSYFQFLLDYISGSLTDGAAVELPEPYKTLFQDIEKLYHQ